MRLNLISRWSKNIVKWFITFMPLYYAPFLFIPNMHSDEWILLRAGKDYIIVIILIYWILHLILRGLKVGPRNATNYFVIFFIVYGMILLAFNYDSEFNFDIARMYVIYPIWFFLASFLYTSRADVLTQVYRWIIVSIGVSIIAIFEWFFFGGNNVYSLAAGQTRAISTLFSPNALGWYLVAINSLVLGLMKFNLSKDCDRFELKYSRAILILLINTAAIVMSGSRSALVVNVLFIGMQFFVRIYSIKVAITNFGLIILFLAYILASGNINQHDLRVLGGFETVRGDLYSEFFNNYWIADFIDILFGFSHSLYFSFVIDGLLSDSFFLSILASGGLVALLIYLLVIISTFIRFYTLRRYRYREQSGLFYLIISGAILGIVGNYQGIFPLSIIFWISLGLLVRESTIRI